MNACQKPHSRLVNPYLFPLLRGWTIGVRSASAVALGICWTSGIVFLVSIFCFGILIVSPGASLALVAAAGTVAAVFSLIGWKLRTAAQSLDEFRPLNKESADSMADAETLLRSSQMRIAKSNELLHPSITSTSAYAIQTLPHLVGSPQLPDR